MAKAYSAKEMAQMEADMDEASAMPPLDLPENAIARDPAAAAQFLWLLLTRDEQIIARLLATVEAYRAQLATATEQSWYTHSSTLGGTMQQSACCPYPNCEQESISDWRAIPHTPDCPVTRARALLGKDDQHAWDEDEQDMQRIADEWSEYDRDPPGS